MRGRLLVLALATVLLSGCAPLSRMSDRWQVEQGLGDVARTLDRQGTAAALAKAERLIAAHPSSAEAAAGCGALFRIAGAPAEALPFYRRSWEIRPTAEIAQSMAICIWTPGAKLGKQEIAAVDGIFRAALRRWPDDPLLLNDYAYFLADLKVDVPKALRLARRAVSLWPSDAAVIDTLGWALYRNGENQEALKMIERALALDGSNAELRAHAAAICRALGMRERARVEAEKARLLDRGGATGKPAA